MKLFLQLRFFLKELSTCSISTTFFIHSSTTAIWFLFVSPLKLFLSRLITLITKSNGHSLSLFYLTSLWYLKIWSSSFLPKLVYSMASGSALSHLVFPDFSSSTFFTGSFASPNLFILIYGVPSLTLFRAFLYTLPRKFQPNLRFHVLPRYSSSPNFPPYFWTAYHITVWLPYLLFNCHN